jgi:hyperosmotically inducible protein
MKINKPFAYLLTVLLTVSSFAFAGSKPGNVMDDAAITTQVKAKLLADKMVSGLDIHVVTNNGNVELSGSVKTDSEASTAIEIAASTPDVKDVDASRLAIEGGSQPFTDSAITAKIKGTYLREKLFGDKAVPVITIHVETKDGVVYLTGKANTNLQAKNAEDLAKSIKGVRDVKSHVSIER